MARLPVLLMTTDSQVVATFQQVAATCDFPLHITPVPPPPEVLSSQWHLIVADAETTSFDAIAFLALARQQNPTAKRGLLVASLAPQELLRAVNEAQVHHVWVKPLSPDGLAKSLEQHLEALEGETLPFLLALSSEGAEAYGHSVRVAHYAVAIGRKLGLSEEALRLLWLGCLLHDIGKVLLPAGQEDDPAWRQQHPLLGEKVVQGLALPKEVAEIVRHHHERWDGQGFPDRLRGEAIPLLARLAALANAYDHWTTPQPEQALLSHAELTELLRREMGHTFAPEAVQALLSLREAEDVQAVLERVSELPALAPIVHCALTLLEREDFDWREVAEVIAQDQHLTAQLLRLANSAMTGLRRRVTSLPIALRVLGARPVRNLLLTLSVYPHLQSPAELRLWEHSLLCAFLARWLAQTTKLVDPEEAFTAGLLHDIGKSLLHRFFPQSYRRLLTLAASQKCPLFIAERLVFSLSHAEVGAWLLRRWRLPTPFCEAVAWHHVPIHKATPLMWHLYWANRLAHFAQGGEPFPPILPPEKANSLLRAFLTNPQPVIKQILAQLQSVEAALQK
ncbi:MAG: hypothetical protein IMHGJWDQ_002032 [Candidatus Fervidibacter sp.]